MTVEEDRARFARTCTVAAFCAVGLYGLLCVWTEEAVVLERLMARNPFAARYVEGARATWVGVRYLCYGLGGVVWCYDDVFVTTRAQIVKLALLIGAGAGALSSLPMGF